MSSGAVFLILPEERFNDGVAFARACMLQCFSRGEAPFAYAAYAQVLDLDFPQEREMALRACVEWLGRATKAICYVDRGVTVEMRSWLDRALRRELPIEFRRLAGGRPSSETMHFQGIAHSHDDCAICLGPERVAELKRDLGKDALTPDELAHLSTLPLPKQKED
jgi:hypothetical protein